MAISRMNMERQLRNMGGIMELEEPRQGYFLGKIVRKAKKAVKKVVKSPIGKAAILGAIGFGIPGTQFGGLLGRASFGGAAPGIFGNTGGIGALLGQGGKFSTIGDVFRVGGKKGADFSALRLLGGGLGAAALAAPFLMGGDEEVIDEGVDVTGIQPMVANIRQQARDYYQDPTQSALYFMPPKSAVQNRFFAADGGLANIDTPKRGMVDEPGSYAGLRLMDEDIKKPRGKFDFLETTGPLTNQQKEILANMSEEEIKELKEKGTLFDFLEDILKTPFIIRGGDMTYADGGLADIPREGYRVGGGILQKAGQMMKAGVGKVKSLFDDADINLSIRDEDVMTDAGLQAQATGLDVFITPKSKKATKVMEDLIDEGYNIAKEVDGSYSVSSIDEGALDIIAKKLRLGGDDLKDFMKSYEDYQGGLRSTGSEEDMIYEALRQRKADGGIMDLGGMEKDYREGGFVPIGAEERADDVPARLSKNEFVFTADAVRNAGGGDIDKGAEVMQNMMDNLEAGGNISEESQGKENPAQAMFDQAQMLEGRLA